MADKEKPLLDFSSGPALVGSAKDAVVKGGTAVVEGVKKGYDAVANTTQDAIDSTKAVITGSIELPEGSDIEADFFKEFGTLLSAEERAKVKAEGVVSAEMIRNILIPKLMSMDNQAKLQKLRTTFQTHAKLSALINIYGFAPITKGEAIPRSEANTSQFMREAKLTGKQAWSDMVQGARTYWNLNTEMDDIAVGRYLVAMRGKALIGAISGIYGNEKVAENPEFLNTSGSFREWRKGDDLAEAIASKGNTKFTDITELSPIYSRSTLHNEYILALVQASADPTKSKISIAGVDVDFGPNETAKLEMIANELDAMREGVEKADPGKFRRFMGGVYQLGEAGQAIIDLGFGAISAPIWAINTFGPLTVWIMASTALVMARRGDPDFKNRGIFGKIFSAPGKLIHTGVKSFKGERSYSTPDEKQAAIDAVLKGKENVRKYADATLEDLREKERLARTGNPTGGIAPDPKMSQVYNSRIDELQKFMREYEANVASGKIKAYYSEVQMGVKIGEIAEGKGTKFTKAIGDIVRGDKGAVAGRARATVKSAFGITPDDLGGKMDDFDEKLKGTKVDAKPVWIEVTNADGSVKREKVEYELKDKRAHSTLYESLAQDLDRYEKYRTWKTLYDVYERNLIALEEAKHDVRYITEAMKSGASGTQTGLNRMISISADGQAAAIQARSVAQTTVNQIVGEMAKLKVGFNISDTTVTVDANTGRATIDNSKLLRAYDNLITANNRGSLASEIARKMLRLGVTPGEIDITLRTAEEAKLGILERIGKKVKVIATKK